MSKTEQEQLEVTLEVIEEARRTFLALAEIATLASNAVQEIWAVWEASKKSE